MLVGSIGLTSNLIGMSNSDASDNLSNSDASDDSIINYSDILENTTAIDNYLRSCPDEAADLLLKTLELGAQEADNKAKELKNALLNEDLDNSEYIKQIIFGAMQYSHKMWLGQYKHIRENYLPEDVAQELKISGNEERRNMFNALPENADTTIIMIHDFNEAIYNQTKTILQENSLL